MGFCCCFQQALLRTLTTRENQTFKANEQETVAKTGTQLIDNVEAALSIAADPVNVCPAPTEHRLSWSHTPHPPSVASSTLFDPEGQAFAKHYNPLLSGETSHGSQHSSEKPSNAIAFRRFGEQIQADSQALPPSCMPGQSSQTALQASSQYAAPKSQLMYTDNITSKMKTEASEEQQEDQAMHALPKVVAGQILADEAEAEGIHKQSSLDKQLGDALRLRNWKGLQTPAAFKEPDLVPPLAHQANLSHVPQPAQMTDAMVLSPRMESALLIAASELGFDAQQDNRDLQSESWQLAAAAQPPHDPASRLKQETPSSIAASDGPVQSAASLTMLQSMTARAASFRPDSMPEAYSPPSPLPSIDRFSSTSSWDGSSTSHSSSIDSSSFSNDVMAVHRHETGSTEADRTQDVLLSDQLGKRQPTPGLSVGQFSSRDAHQSQTSANAMRAMHDSSSSWTERSLAPRNKHASQQDSTASGDKMVCYFEGSAVAEHEVVGILDTASGIEQVPMPTEDKQKDVAVTENAVQGAIDQGQHQVAAFQQGLQSTSLHGACNEVGEPAPSAGAPGLARGVPASVPASPAMAATSAAMSSSKQTLEEMAAWLDAQLAAASGKTPGKAQSKSKAVAPVAATTQSTCPAQAMSHPTGSPPAVPPIAPKNNKISTQRQLPSASPLSKAASAPGLIGRTGSQTRSRPTGLPLARKGSSAGLKPAGKLPAGQAKGPEGTELSVSEMIQWLDSKLAQAVPKQSLMLPSPPIRKTLPDENSLAIQGVSAPDGQHPASEAGSSQWAVSCTEAHSQVETRDTQPGTCSASRLCDSVQAGASKSQQAPQCGASLRQAASDYNCKSDTHFSPSSCDLIASETYNLAAAVSGTESCAPSAALELPAVIEGIVTAKQAAAAAASAVAGPKPSPSSNAVNGLAMPQEGRTLQAKATQTAAEMLQWLDAALAGKKLAAVKAPTAGAATEPKKSSSPSVPVVGTAVMKESPNGNQAHNLKTAGTSDMLAWLDAKIAAQKASIVG
ncbi:TPA: hypothetical protein ACH3X2_002777 [Trebouxia sp. C0005]